MTVSKLDLSRLNTVQLVPPTPFTADTKSIRPEVLGEFVRSAVEAGIRVFLPAAGTGEFHSLSIQEVIKCVRVTRSAAGSDCTVLAPTGLGIDHAIEIGVRAADAGADGLLVMPPIHPYLSDDGCRDYLQTIAREVPLPLLAYKKGPVPSDTLLGELGASGHLVGVKYAVNDLDAFRRFSSTHGARMSLSCGTAERYAPFFMLAGAGGYTSGAGCLCPRLTLAMFRALSSSDYSEAWRILQIIRPIEDYRARENDAFNIGVVKYGLEVLGFPFGPPRAPQRRLTPEDCAEIRTLLEPILLAEADLKSQAGLKLQKTSDR
ncbi:dihydrodipicolinate synthase family protein [Planctomicrobium sp. SH661]|uniref:dihydrodipicolinate synthase family protein n=1 Tax=Planctomicrobium sp. SH661 TaxID=3448124 RepID=UPI003F5C4E94